MPDASEPPEAPAIRFSIIRLTLNGERALAGGKAPHLGAAHGCRASIPPALNARGDLRLHGGNAQEPVRGRFLVI